jgi:hypothetical protein
MFLRFTCDFVKRLWRGLGVCLFERGFFARVEYPDRVFAGLAVVKSSGCVTTRPATILIPIFISVSEKNVG